MSRTSSEAPEAGTSRQALVDRARELWIRRLIDLSRRNNLLYFRDLKTGTLDLAGADADAIRSLLSGESVTLRRLLPDVDGVRAAAQAREILRRAIENLEERGLETLYLALGSATWPSADDGRPPTSPVVLLPIGIELRGREGREIALRRIGDVQVNLVLLHALEDAHGVVVTPESLLGERDDDDETSFDPQPIFDRLAATARGVNGFAVDQRAVLGNFSFQKLAMVKDLQERGAELAAHDLIAALAGDGDARISVLNGRTNPDPRTFDTAPPDRDFFVLDSDASQQTVVTAVLTGQDGVIQGPPGTGKSQTIANLIAALAAEGRRVLFVAEKRAALDVVLRRLEQAGLGHLALDLHGVDISRREVMRQIAKSLELVRDTLPVDAAEAHERFADRRTRLNEHVRRLHARRAPSAFSVFELQSQLLRLSAEARARTRWRGAELDRFDRGAARLVQDLLSEARGFAGLFLRADPSPWTGATLPDGAAVVEAIDLASRLATDRWPAVRERLQAMAEATGLRTPGSIESAQEAVSVVGAVAEFLSVYDAGLFAVDLDTLATSLAPAKRGRLAVAWAWSSDAAFRHARRMVRSLRHGGGVPIAQLLEDVSVAVRLRDRWGALSNPGSGPTRYGGVDAVRADLETFIDELTKLAAFLGRSDLTKMGADVLGRLLDNLATDTETPARLPRLLQIERSIENAGAAAIIRELRDRKPPPDVWPAMFEHAWLTSCLDRARAEDPALGGFNGRTHDEIVSEFCALDRERLALAAARVRRAHAERVVDVMNSRPAEADLVRREAAKASKHLPIRKLLAGAPEVLTVLRPCWMASPLSVSQIIPADRRYFDVVVFDEASQVLPEDGVPSILRGHRTAVAGDRQQLPPTTFFAGGDDEESEAEEPAPVEGFESLLDLMGAFLTPWPLEWHYRSRDEALIAFSNRHIYGDGLITFPGPGGPAAVTHVLVPADAGQDGQEESPSREVERVVELVIEHAERRPHEALGVIALGIKHARRVEAALDVALQDRPDLDAFFDQNLPERFFVKNLERVQGDERDAIILTLGAGKDRVGRLDHRQFGPLNQRGGERRLNVAISRARHRMTVVSSFSHADVDPGRATARGADLLRQYLEYAASQGAKFGDGGTAPVPLNAFEADVRDALTAKGLALLPQWGASRYRIDLVAQHPTRPGRFVLAVECDGATYHSAATARDRDRLRQQHLEALGWRFHRIWSTDWFMRREEEINRALAVFEAAVAEADRVDAGPPDSAPAHAANPSTDNEVTSRGVGRTPRPKVPLRPRIDDYSSDELARLVTWIQSDGRLLTDEEILEEMIDDLGFTRRGRKIEAAIRKAIDASRSRR